MILRPGALFGEATDGDLRSDMANRDRISRLASAPPEWATVTQVHGDRVVEVDGSGDAGDADALFTLRSGLTLAVFTADCLGVVIHAEGAVGVAHAGWRGVEAQVVARLAERMTETGRAPRSAIIGPRIDSCCFEVGEEVAILFPRFRARTDWGTTSVDLVSAVVDQLPGVETSIVGGCTRHDPAYFSHRRDATTERMAAAGWVVS